METVLLVIQIIIAVAMIGLILMQKSSSDGLSGLGGGNSNMGVISTKASANFLTKTTAILAALFMLNSLLLGNLAYRSVDDKTLLDKIIEQDQAKPIKTNDELELPLAK